METCGNFLSIVEPESINLCLKVDKSDDGENCFKNYGTESQIIRNRQNKGTASVGRSSSLEGDSTSITNDLSCDNVIKRKIDSSNFRKAVDKTHELIMEKQIEQEIKIRNNGKSNDLMLVPETVGQKCDLEMLNETKQHQNIKQKKPSQTTALEIGHAVERQNDRLLLQTTDDRTRDMTMFCDMEMSKQTTQKINIRNEQSISGLNTILDNLLPGRSGQLNNNKQYLNIDKSGFYKDSYTIEKPNDICDSNDDFSDSEEEIVNVF